MSVLMKDPTKVGLDELYALAKTNPTVRACLEYSRREICSLDQALITCILILVEQNKDATDRLEKCLSRMTNI